MSLFHLELIIYTIGVIIVVLAFLAYGDYMRKKGQGDK